VGVQFTLGVISLSLLLLISAASAQNPSYGAPHRIVATENSTIDEESQRMAYEHAKKANLERAQQIRDDTNKLSALVAELKDSVNKSSENILSVDVLKKAEQVEKLARSVKQKMKAMR
jgi:hypothetical protein